jgi:hypothetical protein
MVAENRCAEKKVLTCPRNTGFQVSAKIGGTFFV